MLGAHEISSVLGAPNPETNQDPEAVKAFIRQATKIGLSVLLVYPNSKEPADMRTVRTKNADNKAAQEAAKEAGRADWAKVKSPSGLALASTDAKVVLKYLDEYIRVLGIWVNEDGVQVADPKPKDLKDLTLAVAPPVNLAIEVGGSRLVVVDCDTAEQKARFLEWSGAPADLPPTVRSPGQVNADGEMVHKDGGHFYFTVPDHIELPDNLGAITMSGDDGFAVLWNRRYVLIPPSTRPEGPYTLVGDPYSIEDCPPLLAEIQRAGAIRAEKVATFEERQRQRREAAASGGVTNLDAVIASWAESVSWFTILEPLGWSQASRNDMCGCEVWTAGPGHSSPKSATAHDSGCALGRYTSDAPLHIWTDNPGEPFEKWISEHGTKTLSKLQVVALTEFGGNMGKAMDALGLIPPPPTVDAQGNPQDLSGIERDTGVSASNLDTPLDMSKIIDPAQDTGLVPQPPAWGATINTDGSYHISVPSEQTVTIVDPDTGALTDLPSEGPTPNVADLKELIRLDEFAESPAKLNIKCVGCDQVFDKTYIREHEGTEFQRDADQDWWHAEYDPQDGTPDGGHLLQREGDDPATLLEDIAAADPWSAPGQDPASVPAAETPFAEEAEEIDPDIMKSPVSGVPMMAPFSHWKHMPPPEFIIDGLIEHGGLSCMIGAPGIGKSSVALDMACHIATGKNWQGRKTLKTKVLYMPGEGLSGAVQRIASWEEAHGIEVGNNLIVADSIVKLGASSQVWEEVVKYIYQRDIGFIIFDTFARMALAVEENSATEVGKAVERFDQIRRNTHAGVFIVHHTAKHSESGRGSSALNGALDSELIVRRGEWRTEDDDSQVGKALELSTTKQKNAEQLTTPIPLLMTTWVDRNAPLITGPGGSVDPMQGEVVLARPTPEAIVETAIRITKLIRERFSEQGLTRAEIVTYLRPDAHTAGRKDAAKAWKQKVGEAVDRGLRYSLIETLTGTASGQRYVGSTGTYEQAQQLFAAETVAGQE